MVSVSDLCDHKVFEGRETDFVRLGLGVMVNLDLEVDERLGQGASIYNTRVVLKSLTSS